MAPIIKYKFSDNCFNIEANLVKGCIPCSEFELYHNLTKGITSVIGDITIEGKKINKIDDDYKEFFNKKYEKPNIDDCTSVLYNGQPKYFTLDKLLERINLYECVINNLKCDELQEEYDELKECIRKFKVPEVVPEVKKVPVVSCIEYYLFLILYSYKHEDLKGYFIDDKIGNSFIQDYETFKKLIKPKSDEEQKLLNALASKEIEITPSIIDINKDREYRFLLYYLMQPKQKKDIIYIQKLYNINITDYFQLLKCISSDCIDQCRTEIDNNDPYKNLMAVKGNEKINITKNAEINENKDIKEDIEKIDTKKIDNITKELEDKVLVKPVIGTPDITLPQETKKEEEKVTKVAVAPLEKMLKERIEAEKAKVEAEAKVEADKAADEEIYKKGRDSGMTDTLTKSKEQEEAEEKAELEAKAKSKKAEEEAKVTTAGGAKSFGTSKKMSKKNKKKNKKKSLNKKKKLRRSNKK